MPARGRELKREPGIALADDIGEIPHAPRRRRATQRWGCTGQVCQVAAYGIPADQGRQVGSRMDDDAVDELGLGGILHRDDDVGDSGSSGR